MSTNKTRYADKRGERTKSVHPNTKDAAYAMYTTKLLEAAVDGDATRRSSLGTSVACSFIACSMQNRPELDAKFTLAPSTGMARYGQLFHLPGTNKCTTILKIRSAVYL